MNLPDAEPTQLAHGVAIRAAAGEIHCGDHWVAHTVGPRTLLAVIDGLGHGAQAAAAASLAADTITRHAELDLAGIMTETHNALRTTRGAAVSLSSIADRQLQWLAVGNVQGVVHQTATDATTRLVTRGGIVGSRLPRLQTTETTLDTGDVLAMFTDGVSEELARGLTSDWEPRLLAPWLLGHHATGTDDALVLIARHGQDPT